MENEEIKIIEVVRLRVRPGDALVLHVTNSASMEQRIHLEKYIEAKLGVKALVLPEGGV
jgi:hypothetical protein